MSVEKFSKYTPLFWATLMLGVLYGLMMWGVSLLQTSPSLNVADLLSPPQEVKDVATTTSPSVQLFQYIEVVDGCGSYFEGPCVNMRSGPGIDHPVVARLRNGVVLKVDDVVTHDGQDWYKIGFDGYIHYPERVTGDWYVAREHVRLFTDEGDKQLSKETPATSTKRIVIDLSEQMLYAYDGDIVFMKEPVSSGLKETPTPRGIFSVYKKTPSRYMQGPIPEVSDQYFDLPGVPWNLYFTYGGAVIHGAYWHDYFGKRWSHGCVNLSPEKAKELYLWADVGISVVVRD